MSSNKKPTNMLMILTVLTFILFFSSAIYLIFNKQLSEVKRHKNQHVNPSDWYIEITKKEFQQKLEKRNYNIIFSALSSIWVKNVSIVKDKTIISNILWKEINFSYSLDKDNVFEKSIFIKNLEEHFVLNPTIIKNIKKNYTNKFSKSIDLAIKQSIIEDKNNYYIVFIENAEWWKVNSLVKKISLTKQIYKEINNIKKELLKNDDNVDFFDKLINNEEYISKNISLLLLYKIDKKTIKNYSKENTSEIISKILVSSFYKQLFNNFQKNEKFKDKKIIKKSIKDLINDKKYKDLENKKLNSNIIKYEK